MIVPKTAAVKLTGVYLAAVNSMLVQQFLIERNT